MSPIESDKFKNAENKIYPSLAALSKATGIPKKALSKAKNEGLAGFNSNATVNLALARPALIDNYDRLLTVDKEGKEYWSIEKIKKDCELRDLEIRKQKETLITPEEVKQLLAELATEFSVTLNKVIGELPPKLAGKSEQEIKAAVDEALAHCYKLFSVKGESIH